MRLRKIGDVAKELGISDRRIREYERAGLLRPQRQDRTNDRLFDELEVRQIRTIQHLIHERGHTIASLQDLIARAPCWALTGCEVADGCPVVRDARTPCYAQRAAGLIGPYQCQCERCAIYKAKNGAHEPVVVHPCNGAEG